MGGGLQRKLLAEPFSLVLAKCSVHASLQSLSVASDAVGARQVGGAKMRVDRKMCSLVAGPEAELSVVEFVAAVSVDSPFTRAPGPAKSKSALPCAPSPVPAAVLPVR